MARIRSIKPEFWTDEDLVCQTSRDERMLYVGLWNLADEHARLRGDPRYIKGQLFPYDDDLTSDTIASMLEHLVALGKVVSYASGPCRYLYLPNLGKHQRLEGGKVSSKLPAPDEGDTPPVTTGTHDSAPRAEKSAPHANGSAPGADKKALSYGAWSMEHGEELLPSKTARAETRAQETETPPPALLPLPSQPPVPAVTPKPPRRRDELFDAVASVCGVDVATLTTSGRGVLNGAVKQLRDVGATADGVRARGSVWHRRYPTTTLTAPALAKHWASLAAAAQPRAPVEFDPLASARRHN